MFAHLLLLLSVFTTHSNQTFHTQCAVEVNAPAAVADEVIEQLIYDFQYDFEHLFDWAFLDLGKQNNEDRDALLLASRAIVYNPEKEYGRITMDVIIPGFITIPGILVEGIIRDERGDCRCDTCLNANSLPINYIPHYSRRMYIEANRTGGIFEKAYGNLYVIPKDSSHSVYVMDINMRFEWFLRIFVSKRVWRNTLQWRAVNYLNNLKRAAEYPEFMQQQPQRELNIGRDE